VEQEKSYQEWQLKLQLLHPLAEDGQITLDNTFPLKINQIRV